MKIKKIKHEEQESGNEYVIILLQKIVVKLFV